jgi:hypothetical protein
MSSKNIKSSQCKGQWIINKLREDLDDCTAQQENAIVIHRLWNMDNDTFDKIMDD